MMKIGVDSCIIVAGVHANHPIYPIASDWLIRNISQNELVVAHHSILEAYAVLTRLPGEFRITSYEAKQLLETTVQANMITAEFSAEFIWDCIDSLSDHGVSGGRSYDGFIAKILIKAGVEAIATFNISHFKEFASNLKLIDPTKPGLP